RHRLARDPYPALLERLAQRVERARRELAELVEKQHTAMRERDLAGPGAAAPAADERGGGCRVGRGAERPRASGTAGRGFAAGRRVAIGPGLLTFQAGAELTEGTGGAYPHAADQRSLGGVRERDDDAHRAGAGQGVDQRERARHGPHRAVEPELAEHGDSLEH